MGGWSLQSTAEKMAKSQSDTAVVAVLAPVCADKFRAMPDAKAKQVSLTKVDSWKRRDEFPKEFVTLSRGILSEFGARGCLLSHPAITEVGRA